MSQGVFETQLLGRSILRKDFRKKIEYSIIGNLRYFYTAMMTDMLKQITLKAR